MLEDPSVDTVMFNRLVTQVGILFFFSSYIFTIYVVQLQKGANDGRSDDIRRVKEEVTVWINQACSPSVPLNPKNRDNCGLQNNFTGRLLCPIEHSWDDLEYVSRFIFSPTQIDQSWTVSVPEFAMVNWTYLKIILSHVSIQRDMETQMMSKTTSFEVVCLLRWVFLFHFCFWVWIIGSTTSRHFVLSLPLHRLLRHLKNTNLMMDQLGRCRRHLHKRRQQRVLWQVFSTWKARLLPGL